MTRPRVLIVGGGFAGLACSQQLAAERFDVTLVDRKRHFEFLPALHEILSARKTAAQVRLPLAALLRKRGHRFRQGEVTAIAPEQLALQLADGAELTADYLVLSPGSVEAGLAIAGVGHHGRSLRSVADAFQLRRDLQTLQRGPRRPRVVIVGAGWTGIEVLGELLRDQRPRAPELHLVDSSEQLMPGAPRSVAKFLAAHCSARGVTQHLNRRVARVTAKTLFFSDGERLRNDLLLWTAGAASSPLLNGQGNAPALDSTPLNRDLSLAAQPRCYVAGDSAHLRRPLPRQAYHAIDMGLSVASNIARAAAGRKSRAFRPLPRPSLLAFGEQGAILIAGRQAIAGVPVALAKEAVYQTAMGQLDRRDTPDRLDGLRERAATLPRQLWPLLNDWRQLRQQVGVTILS